VPIYDYVCRNCGHVVEVIHGINEDGPAECPVCGGPVRRALTAPTVHFKGSGWAKKERTTGPASSSKDGAETAKTESDSGPSPAAEPSKPAESSSSEAS